MNNDFSKIDKNLIDAARRGDTDAIMSTLNAEDRKKIEQTLTDKNKLQQILSSDAAKNLIKILGGK